MFSLNKQSTQIWLLRLGAFVLTAAAGVALSGLPGSSRIHTLPVERQLDVLQVKSPSAITSFPKVDFPDSLRQLDSTRFFIELTANVGADGKVRSVEADDPRFEITVRQQSYLHTVIPRIGTARALALRRELVQVLTRQLESIKFSPSTNQGASDCSLVGISVYFRSITAPTGNGFRCAQMSTTVSSGGIIWEGITSTDRYTACAD